MNNSGAMVNLQIPTRMWIELHAGDPDARDVIVKMEDGTIYTALFVTIPYLHRQMDLTFDLSSQIPDTVPSRFCALDIPHIAVESLERDAIEDTIDNLMAMEVFESVFTQITDPPETTTQDATRSNGRRATQEVAAVVLSEVLVVEEE